MSNFPDLSADELASFHKIGEEAAQHFEQTLAQLSDLARRFDPLEVLARMAMTTITSQARFGAPDYDPVLHVYHLEFFQAVALSEYRRSEWEAGAISDVTNEIIRLVNENAEAFRDRELRSLTCDGQKNAFNNLIDQVQVTTQTVRGSRHSFQTREYLRSLAQQLDGDFQRTVGCTLSAFLDFIESLAFQLDERLEEFRARQRPWMIASAIDVARQRFEERNPQLKGSSALRHAVATSADLQELKYALLTLIEHEYLPIFVMRQPSDASLRNLVNAITLTFGSIDANSLGHLHLNNPVWRKPFIGLDADHFFWPNPQSLFAFLVEIVDDLAEPNPQLKARIEKVKARWVERKLGELLEKAFPSGRVLKKVHWADSESRAHETDAVVLIDKVVAIFEAKSGRVSQPARRGAQDRLRREIKRLIIEPSDQSDALRTAITNGSVDVHSNQGSTRILRTEAREFVRVNVLFDTIGTLSAHWPQLVAHGLADPVAPLAPTMSIFELETIFDALPSEIRRLHYLKRREEIERHTSYIADELDLLALYFDTGFVIGPLEFQDRGFGIYGLSEKVAKAYDHLGRTSTFDLAVKESPLWGTLLRNLSALKPVGWTRFGFRLCSISYKSQMKAGREVDRAFRKARKIRRSGAVHFGFSEGPKGHRNVIVFSVGKSLSEAEITRYCNDVGGEALMEADADSCLVIHHDFDARRGQFRFIATIKRLPAGTPLHHLAPLS